MKNNRIHQRALSLLLSFALVFGMIQMTGISAFAEESSGVTAYYNGSGLFKDSGYTQAVSPYSEYQYLSSVTRVVVKDSTETIGDYACDNCNHLTEITIPDSVTSIGKSAFSCCASLPEIKIPAGVTSISEHAFDYCTSLKNVTFGTGSRLESIGNSAFYDCKQLSGIAIPAGVTSIGASAFSNCYHLTGIAIPSGVTSIGDHTFYDCESLTGITIPAGVTSIDGCAFYGCSSLTGIAIPDSVTSIGNEAFSACTAMQSITVGTNNTNYSSDGVSLFSRDRTELIASSAGKTGSYQVPDSVTSIGENAFAGSKMTDISFGTGSSLTSVGAKAFSGCERLTKLTFPDSVNTIANNAFEDCINLKSITLPESLKSISSELFSNCGSLASVTIPKHVTSISRNCSAFWGCNSLEAVNVEQGNANYCSSDGVLYTMGANGNLALTFCPLGKAGVCTVKAGTTDISNPAFASCSKLTDIILPEGLTTIWGRAFKDCTGLTKIDLPESVTGAQSDLFAGCTGLRAATVSENLSFSGDNRLFVTAGNLYVVKDAAGTDHSPACENKFYFTKSADSSYRFQSYTGTKVGIVIPTELYGKPISPAIQPGDLAVTPFTAYSDGNSLYSDSACHQENEINRNRYCEVTNIVIGSGVTQISESAFYDCSSLTEITIPAGVTDIGFNSFFGCSALQSITVASKNSQYCSRDGLLYRKEASGKLALSYCPKAHSGKLEIPSDVSDIEECALKNCSGLTNVNIPSGVTQIGSSAFKGCTGLTDVTIPSGVTKIDENTFEGCTGLTTVTIPSGVTEIDDRAFAGCTGLTNVNIPSGVTQIRYGAFAGCAGLTNVTIPSGMTEIGSSAFSGCTGLKIVVLEGASTTLDYDAFNLEQDNRRQLTFALPVNPGNGASSPERNDSPLAVYVPQANLDFYNAEFSSDVLGDTAAEIKAIPVISAFDTPSPIIVPKGTAPADLSLPQTLLATVNGEPHKEVSGVTWNAERPYDLNITGSYGFTAVLPFYCRTVNNPSMPKLSVHVVDTGKSILKFTIGSSTGMIDEAAHTVAVTVPSGTDLTALAPVIAVSSGATVSPASGTPRDFTKPVIYTVTAQSGSKQTYTVTVMEEERHSSDTSVASLPSGVTDTASNAQIDLSGAAMPAGVTRVTLSVTPETATGTPVTPGTAGGASDPQGAAAFKLAVSDTGLNIIGAPVLYNLKLLDQNGNTITGFSGKATVKIPLPAGLRGTPHVFRYEESTGTFTDMNAVVENGFLVFSTEHFSYYAVAGVGDSLTLDTKSYQMPVGGKYQVGLKLTGSKAASVKFRSTNDKIAAVTKPKNGNYLIVGTGTGTVWIMFDVYDHKNRLLTHASVKIDVKTGIRPRGDSTRQTGVF